MQTETIRRRQVVKPLHKPDWGSLIKRIMFSYNDISRSINPKGLLKIDLTTAQIKLLTCFSDNDHHTMSELSKKLSVSLPTITAMVNRLEHSKMVRRERDRMDRRVVKVSLTKSGHRELTRLVSIREKEMERILMNLTGEEMTRFLISIEAVARLLTKARQKRDVHGEKHINQPPPDAQ
jgi:DNA-binding MarR family transcriptional regulator